MPLMEQELEQLRQQLAQRADALGAAEALAAETAERLRLREAAAPELAAAELLATEAERLEEVR